MDVSPRQIVSVATALIPFLEHDDANRALMGANMQRQAVPLVRAEAPYIGTGIEYRAARDAADVIRRRRRRGHRGRRRLITVNYNDDGNQTYRCTSSSAPTRTPASTSGPSCPPGEKVVEGGHPRRRPSSTDNGELALGKNLLVAFMPWEGYNFEDAIILSERLVKDDVLTSIHIEEHEVDARDTKLGPEEITRDIPNLSDDILADLDERGIIRIGAEVGPATCWSARSPQGRDRAHPRGAPAARHLR
jgi:DNA-directed RNA polymerase subunit beta